MAYQLTNIGHNHFCASLQVLQIRIKDRLKNSQVIEGRVLTRKVLTGGQVELRVDKFEIDRRNSGDQRKRTGITEHAQISYVGLCLNLFCKIKLIDQVSVIFL